MNAITQLEQDYRTRAQAMTGTVSSPRISCAEPWSIKLWANAFDPKNPLYHDADYAASTAWGSLIAPPLYQECMTLTSWNAPIPPELGHLSHGAFQLPFMLGEEWEFYQPVRSGEHYQVCRNTPKLTKDDSDDSDGVIRYTNMTHDVDLFDSQGQKVSNCKCYLRMWLSHLEIPRLEPSPYRYTQNQLQHIDEVYHNEVIRGNQPRYLQDVRVGERLPDAVLGPTTVWDMLVMTVGRQDQELLPMMALRDQPNAPSAPDPITNVPKCFMECHLANDTAHQLGLPNAIHAGAVDRSLLVRIVTNWMGNDGFITRFAWQPLKDTYVGDTLFASAWVTDVDEAAGLCSINAMLQNQKGVKTAAAQITVRLPDHHS